MGTELETKSPFGSNLSLRGVDAMAKAMAAAATDGARGMAPEGSVYLNFSGKRGVYELGQDKADIDEDELWVINVESFQAGWVCWRGGSPVATRLASIYSQAQVPTPDPDEHGPFGDGEGWFKAKALVAKSLDRDVQVYFKTNSKSGVSEIADLQMAVSEKMQGGQAFWPVITFGREKFQARGKTNYKPNIAVYGWLSTAAIQLLAEDADADIDELIKQSAEGTVASLDDATEDFEDDDGPAEAEVEEVEAEEVTEAETRRVKPSDKRRANIGASKAAESEKPRRRARL